MYNLIEEKGNTFVFTSVDANFFSIKASEYYYQYKVVIGDSVFYAGNVTGHFEKATSLVECRSHVFACRSYDVSNNSTVDKMVKYVLKKLKERGISIPMLVSEVESKNNLFVPAWKMIMLNNL